jgi:amino acid transporter
MNWSEVPILVAIVVGFVGFCLMVASFVMVARQGGWKRAMRSEPGGRWSLPRRLMFAGAFFGIVFSLTVAILFLIPGGIPWMDGSDWGTALISVLTGLAAVWYFIIKRPQTASRHSEQSNIRPDR